MIEINNLEKHLNKKLFFKKKNFCFGNGLYHLKGANGTGKTVLLNILVGLDTKISGTIINSERKQPTLYLGSGGIGFPFLTIEENIRHAAKILRLTLDDGYQKLFDDSALLTQNYDKSSLGTQQKVGLALLFTKEKLGLIVLDEALNSLDAASREIVSHRLLELTGVTRIMVFHEEAPEILRQEMIAVPIEDFKERVSEKVE